MRRILNERFLSDAELARFMAAVRARGSKRDVAMFTLLSVLGIRPSEALWLRPSHLHLSRRPAWIRVRRLKKRSTAPVYDDMEIPDSVAEAVQAFLADHGADDAPLFTIQKRTAQRLFHSYARKAGLPRRLYLYCLRHTAATRIYRATRDIRVVQAVLGHDSPETSCVYAHITRGMLRGHADAFPVAL